jgi:hypothetical protein
MALSLNSVTPIGHVNNIIDWCAGIFNIRGLTFRHELSKKSIYGFLGKGTKEEFESKC